MNARLEKKLNYFTGGLISLINLLFVLLSFYEWMNVNVFGAKGYPFGTEGPVPYYYVSSKVYSAYVFQYGIINLLLLLINIKLMIHNTEKTYVGIGISLLTMIVLAIFTGDYQE